MDRYAKRRNIIVFLILLVGFVYLIRLFSLQVIEKAYKRTARQNVLREVIDYPSRGLIYDRNGALLVSNQASYDLMVIPREAEAFDTLLLCSLLQIDPADFTNSMKKAAAYSRYKPSIVVKQIASERYALLQEKMYKFSGFYFQTRTLRSYTYPIAAHVLGYVGEVNNRIIEKDPYYRAGDYYGVTGLEYAYEKELRGKKGVSFYLVDVHNRIKGSYERGRLDTSAVKGNNLTVTIDRNLQAYGEELMQNKAGSIVAIEPSTGEILALVSFPTYNPGELVGRSRMENFPRLLSDTLLPLFNRAVKAQYPPGSTFKMVHALIGLQEGIITPSTSFHCAMGYHVGNFSMGCHHNQDFRLSGSIAQSCNAYYAHVFRNILDAPKFGGTRNGYEQWRKHVLSMGFSGRVSPELDEELNGLIPSVDYFQERVFHSSRWRSLPIVSLAIGQGEIQTTPIQMANYAALLANRGHYFPPHLVRKIENSTVDPSFREKRTTTIDPVHFEEIIEGMEWTLSWEHSGTASGSSIPGIVCCGKTGTAQNPHGQDHSTFIGFAPKDKPQIAIAVYIEKGKWGSTFAAPIATLLIEYYLNGTIQDSRKNLEKRMMETNLLYPDRPNFIRITE
ncbi:MAG TPA: penicillin-binding protein 2 [Prolixibacteraceae bacterium]|nr:penicillin-binding protein 2 [Prolixibacteraceae bacterium]